MKYDSEYARALTNWEARNYLDYMRAIGGGIYMLGQNQEKHGQFARTDMKCLNTIIKSCRIMMCDHPGINRWMFWNEMLGSQGFPVTEEFVKCSARGKTLPLCSFNVDRSTQSQSPRKVIKVKGQARNTMNVNMIGAAAVFVYGFVVLRTSMLPDLLL